MPRREGWRYIAVNDAWRLVPHADVLYACDLAWWNVHNGVPDFKGQKWTSHDNGTNDKRGCRFPLNYVRGADRPGFSLDPELIHYGSNSGFQAVNLAILAGATEIHLYGFDMRKVGTQRHFFGDHEGGLHNVNSFHGFIQAFRVAAKDCPVPIYNATPGSALDCFRFVEP